MLKDDRDGNEPGFETRYNMMVCCDILWRYDMMWYAMKRFEMGIFWYCQWVVAQFEYSVYDFHAAITTNITLQNYIRLWLLCSVSRTQRKTVVAECRRVFLLSGTYQDGSMLWYLQWPPEHWCFDMFPGGMPDTNRIHAHLVRQALREWWDSKTTNLISHSRTGQAGRNFPW